MQTINRALLNRLRPAASAGAARPLLELLVRGPPGTTRRSPSKGRFAALKPGYGDLVDLTVYRCVQEGLTNALRHAGASRVTVEVAERDAGLRLSVDDDGGGLGGEPAKAGLGRDARAGRGPGRHPPRPRAARPGTSLRIALPTEPDTPEETP